MNYFFLYDSTQVHHIIEDTSDEIKSTLQMYHAPVEEAERFFTEQGIDVSVLKEYFPERYPDEAWINSGSDMNINNSI